MSGRRAVVIAGSVLVLALGLAPGSRAATVTLVELELPDPKAGLREIKYALGKDWEAALRREVEGDLAAPKLFDAVVAEGGDWAFTMALDRLSRTFDDRVATFGRGTMAFRAEGRWSWSRGGVVVAEGPFDTRHSVTIDHEPWRSDVEAGWREVIRLGVSEAVTGWLAAGLPAGS